MKKDIFFNIMVRTSNRPNYFSDCIKSIRSQIYENYRIIVSVDNYFSKKYVEKLNIKPVSIDLIKKKKFKHYAPYNLYINELYKYVNDGYILILDDDDEFTKSNSLELLCKEIKLNKNSKENLYIFKSKLSSQLTVPRNYSANKIIYPGNVTSCGFCIHSKWIFAAKWDEFKESDFRVINKLNLVTDKTILISNTLTKIQTLNQPGLGQQKDKIC